MLALEQQNSDSLVMKMKLTTPKLEEFEPVLRRILGFALGGGISKLESRGHKLKEIETNAKLRRQFIRDCHAGYDQAQTLIAANIFANIERINQLKNDQKRVRNSKDHELLPQIAECLFVLNNRNMILRRVIDAMGFMILGMRGWVARRMPALNYIKSVDPKAARVALREAQYRNNRDKLKFNLVADLSTFIDIGDLLAVDFTVKCSHKWRIIELKEGRVNELLQGVIDAHYGDISDEMIESLSTKISHKAPKQLRRMVNQIRRISNTEKVKTANLTIDNLLNMELHLTKDETPIDSWESIINDMLTHAERENYCLKIIDSCLYVAAVKGGSFMARHSLYHAVNNHSACAFIDGDSARISEEIAKIKTTQYLVDITTNNLAARDATPIFCYHLEQNKLIDLLFNRLSLVVYLDFNKLIDRAMKDGINMRLLTKKETGKMKCMMPHNTLVLFNGRCVELESSKGKNFTLGTGFYSRVFVDLQSPLHVLKLFSSEHQFYSS